MHTTQVLQFQDTKPLFAEVPELKAPPDDGDHPNEYALTVLEDGSHRVF